MRKIFAAASVLLLSTHVTSADPFDDHVRALGRDVAIPAYEYLDCAEAAAKEAARLDPVTPSSWMSDWAAIQAAQKCEPEGKALVAAAGNAQADAITAMVHKASVEAALSVRRPPQPILCAVGAHRGLCSMW